MIKIRLAICILICVTAIIVTRIVCSTFSTIALEKHRIEIKAAQDLLRQRFRDWQEPSLDPTPNPNL